VTPESRGQALRAGAVGAVALGVAVAGLQALQAVAGSFNPSWVVTALFALAAIFASLVAQRFAARHREAEADRERRGLLRSSLRVWPLRPLAEISDGKLGVFPPRRSLADGAYVKRDLDRRLGEVLPGSAPVVVIGPPRAGKSRTASQVARDALERRLAVIPRDADALRRLLELDPPLDFGNACGVLWLDGLERYLEALDGETLDALARAGVPLVATVRDETWEKLLGGEGREAEAAKALAGRALAFELPATLSPDEAERAEKSYPDEDLRHGIGPALATSGREALRPPDREEPPSSDGGPGVPGPARSDPLVLVPAALCVVALLTIGLLALVGRFEKAKPPTIAEQAQDARRQGSAGPREVVDAERVDFHDTGEESYFYAFGDADGVPQSEARSDELQVFDKHGEDLEREFRFEPRPIGDPSSPEQLLFQFRFIGDIDGDGADELVGGYGTPAIPGELIMPFAVDWDEDAERYRIVSLAREPASLDTRGRGADAEGLRAAYARRLRLTDVDEPDLALGGYPSQDFAVTVDPHRMLSAYVSQFRRGGAERIVEIQASTFQRTGGRPRVARCRLGARALAAKAPRGNVRSLYAFTLETWLEASKDRFCVPVG
jgi:hypothetical protein